MRIPVSRADLDQGRFTKISRSLQKLWTATSLGLMQAQNLLSTFFGYRDFHDVQQSALDVCSWPGPKHSRKDILEAVAWQMFRRQGLGLIEASEITKKLHLESLEIDTQTPDYEFQRLMELQSKETRYYLDEAAYYFSSRWNPKTPQLLDAGIPGYEFAVFPDQRVFIWSVLEALLEHLPADYLEDIRHDPRYASLAASGSKAQENAFILQELFPMACKPLSEATQMSAVRPKGLITLYLFTEEGDCVGRALFNQEIGGIVPRVFDANDDRIYDTIGEMLRGELIIDPVTAAEEIVSNLHVLRYPMLSNQEFLKNKTGRYSQGRVAKDKIEPIKANVVLGKFNDVWSFHGDFFVEGQQPYFRCQEDWVVPADVPAFLWSEVGTPEVLGKPRWTEHSNSWNVVPESASSLKTKAKQSLNKAYETAATYLQTQKGFDALLKFIFEYIEPQTFDAYCDGIIDECLPVKEKGATENDPDLVKERHQEMVCLDWDGREIQRAIPELSRFKKSSLGLVILLVSGGDLGPRGRRNVFIRPPVQDKRKDCAAFLSGLMLYVVHCKAKQQFLYGSISDEILMLAASRVIWKEMEPKAMRSFCQTVQMFEQRLAKHGTAEKIIEQWRQSTAEIEKIRASEGYLYVGGRISREKPKTMADFAEQARSLPFSSVMAKQEFNGAMAELKVEPKQKL